MIVFDDVSRVYTMGDTQLRALDHANMHIKESEFVAVIGPSGSGKSTLMNIMGCLDLADEPTGNLDSSTSEDIMQIFRELNDIGNTIVLITHDDEVAMQANRRIRIRDGHVGEVD